MTEGGESLANKANYGFRLTTGRLPTADESAILIKFYGEQFAEYQANVEAAKQLLGVGETKRDEALDPAVHAAWTMTANLILNLDETVTKE